ncbi:MAG TPA: hypothetical protein VGM54_02000 [Chthoniobacter sp.]|jgi:hypothetical protein
MTPKRAFDSGGQNPNSSLWVRDWYGVGCTFVPNRVRHQGVILFGFRILGCMDMASHYSMYQHFIPQPPDALRATDVIQCLEDTIARHGPPRIGVAISHSVWLSSAELLLDEDTRPQGKFLHDNEIEFGPMSYQEKVKIEAWASKFDIHCEFDADNISNYSR